MRNNTYTLPDCPLCGFNYPDADLVRHAKGEVQLDPTPVHMCRPRRV